MLAANILTRMEVRWLPKKAMIFKSYSLPERRKMLA
jgi:hypothetical protein